MSVSFADIEAAAGRLKGQALVTPLVESPALNARLGLRVLLKLETLQRVGAFKFRGAYNRLVQLSAEERARGVVAFSSGNHAQGVALAAKLLSMPALIVMPSDAPAVKIAATRDYGAEVRLYDRLTEDRVALSEVIAADRRAVVVPAFDDPHIVAGQGTVGLEMVSQAAAMGASFDAVLAPVSGGGLLAGVSEVMKTRCPATACWGIEPAGFEDLRLSLAARERVTLKSSARSLCDALESPAPGVITFPMLLANIAGAIAITDAEAAEAVRTAFQTLKLVAEPSGAVGLAALLAGKLDVAPGATVGVIVSGGNVDPELFSRIIRGEL